MTVEEVIPQNQADRIISDKLLTNNKRLSKSFRLWLNRVRELKAPFRAISQQAPETCAVFRCGDDQDHPDCRQHQNRERIVDNRYVIDWHQLFTDRYGYGI